MSTSCLVLVAVAFFLLHNMADEGWFLDLILRVKQNSSNIMLLPQSMMVVVVSSIRSSDDVSGISVAVSPFGLRPLL